MCAWGSRPRFGPSPRAQYQHISAQLHHIRNLLEGRNSNSDKNRPVKQMGDGRWWADEYQDELTRVLRTMPSLTWKFHESTSIRIYCGYDGDVLKVDTQWCSQPSAHIGVIIFGRPEDKIYDTKDYNFPVDPKIQGVKNCIERIYMYAKYLYEKENP